MVFGQLKSRVSGHFVFEGCPEEHIFVDIEHAILNVFLTECREEFTIEVIGNSAAVKHLTDHVL